MKVTNNQKNILKDKHKTEKKNLKLMINTITE